MYATICKSLRYTCIGLGTRPKQNWSLKINTGPKSSKAQAIISQQEDLPGLERTTDQKKEVVTKQSMGPKLEHDKCVKIQFEGNKPFRPKPTVMSLTIGLQS